MVRLFSALALTGLLLTQAGLSPLASAQQVDESAVVEPAAAQQADPDADTPDLVLEVQTNPDDDRSVQATAGPAPTDPQVLPPAPTAEPTPAKPLPQTASTPTEVYPTRNGPRTTAQLHAELAQIGYSGPWDLPSVLAAYDRAAAPPSPPPATTTPSPPTPTPEPRYETRKGSKTATQLHEELTAAGYSGPWDVSAMLAAYERANAPVGPALRGEAATACRSDTVGGRSVYLCLYPSGNGAMWDGSATSATLLGSTPPGGQAVFTDAGLRYFGLQPSLPVAPTVPVLPGLAVPSISSAVESRIDGEFTGWDGNTAFRLQNGQVWVQSAYAYHYHYAYSPRVLVYPSSTGWRLQVEGDSDNVQVARVR